jgi:putative PEP-CTERM system TPR-repeat lipoprotein
MRGVIYVAKQDYARARASFEQAMKADPTFMPAISNLANLDVAEQDYKAAKERYEEVLKHAPNDSQVWLALANLADRQKDIEGYRSYLEKAKRANDKNVEVRQRLARYWLDRNNSGLALAEAREGLAATGNKSFYEYIGMALAIQGDTQGALDTFERWSQDSPDSDVAWVRLAQAQAGAGKRRDALASVDRALAIAPNAIEPMNLKMLLLAQQGNRDEALRLARLLQSRQPKSPVGFLGEAEVLSATKKYLEAAKLYEKVAQMTGQSQYTARAYQSYAAAGQASAGVLLLEQSLRAKPDDFKLRHQLAQALINANRQKEAAEQYRLLLRLNPEDVIASNNLAMLLSDLKDPGAVAAAEQAHKLRPENVVIQDSLGWVLVNNGQGARGIKMIKQAYDAKPDSPDFQWHYAKALALTGEPVLARHELESLLARYKNLPQADEARQLLASLKH